MTLTLTTERMAEIAKLAIRLQQISGCAAVTSSGETIMHHTFVDTILSALHDVTAELLANREAQPVAGECNKEVYENGQSVCLVDIPKETAEVICRGISQATGCKVDWHYIGGRVHIKALAPPAPAVNMAPDFEAWFNSPEAGLRVVNFHIQHELQLKAWDACCAAMLAQPVSQGYTLPDGWIACGERMPEPNKNVLVSNGVWVGIGMYNDAEHFEDDERWQDEHHEFIDLLHHPVTHWMPLPAAPEGGNG